MIREICMVKPVRGREVYCLKGIDFGSPEGFLPELAAGAAVVLSYVWKRDTLLSIVAGTVFYMILI